MRGTTFKTRANTKGHKVLTEEVQNADPSFANWELIESELLT